MAELSVRTVAEDSSLRERIEEMYSQLWPRAILEGHPAGDYEVPAWSTIYEHWPQYQFGLLDADGHLICAGNALELPWHDSPERLPEGGYEWAMTTARQAVECDEPANMLCALGITVAPAHRGRAISRIALEALHALGRRAGHTEMIAPVRPTAKIRYPLIPMQAYMEWRTADGFPFDPWLRTHVRVGGQMLKSCSCSATLQGSVAEWVQWGEGLALPGSGDYLLPGLYAPVQIDVEHDCGLYVEPAVWVVHRFSPDGASAMHSRPIHRNRV